MKTADYLNYLVNEIHSTVMATVDEAGRPATCAIDMMDTDGGSLFFLTAKGKAFYERLTKNRWVALTGMKGKDTLSCVAVSVQGRVREIGPHRLPLLFQKNPYMEQIYPTVESRAVLTVFQIYQGEGEWFDLRQLPVERASFAFGGAQHSEHGYFVGEGCVGCGICRERCPQHCIEIADGRAVICQEHCIHCGSCCQSCPQQAIEKRGF